MKILFSPQVNDLVINYEFGKDVITATLNGVTDTFDFGEMPDGKIDNPFEDIETTLDVNVIISAERVGGELKVELLNFIGFDAAEEERFPEWFEVKDDGKD